MVEAGLAALGQFGLLRDVVSCPKTILLEELSRVLIPDHPCLKRRHCLRLGHPLPPLLCGHTILDH